MLKSVQSLRDRVGVLHQFLCDVRIGKVDLQSTGDQQILRDIKGLCMRLPVMEEDKFRSELLAVRNQERERESECVCVCVCCGSFRYQ